MSVLREGFEYEFSAIDPVGSPHIDPPSIAIYETLLRQGVGHVPLPGLAVSWGVAPDGLSWTFVLRAGARFHSGEPCDAAAVVAALHGCRWGDHPERQLWYWDAVDEVTAIDESTVSISLHHPYPRLPALLWGTHTAIHNERLRLAHPGEYGFTVVDGTGPYRLVSWSRDEIVAESVEEDESPRTIVWTSLVDEDARRRAARADEVSVLRAPPWGLWQELGESHGAWDLVELPQDSNAYLALNFRRADLDFDKDDMRRAVSLAIDRPELVREAFGGHAAATLGPVPPHDPYFRGVAPELVGGARPSDAIEVLEGLGWVPGDDGVRERDGVRLEFECVTQDSVAFHLMATVLQRNVRAVGIAIDVRFVPPFADFYAACEQDPPAILSKWLWPDPLEAIVGFTSAAGEGSPNWQHASVPELEDAYVAWRTAATAAEYDEAATRVQRLFSERLPYIPLLTPTDTWLVRRDEHDFVVAPEGLYPEYGRAARARQSNRSSA